MARSIDKQRQRGVSLVEALVAMVLLSVLGLGMAHALGRTMMASKFHKAQSLAVQGVRADLQTNGMAQGCPNAGETTSSRDLPLGPNLSIDDVNRTCRVVPVIVTIDNIERNTTSVQLQYEVRAETLLGPGTLTLRN
ncbi:hypothetical protein G8A07_11715 [Roseateles sp. DAIF2]|uniref:type IV pilus modification PilV family protein n=1 Tax=Roseateles sp. DAIF2 TaxID=2714952 RepID=UPI0018A2F7F1|nr:prepilin-type N-terminal cleavage/methylation domain-containing protein [Roseateles sp. DAIF2]QPF73521.1 hypothetical protein G8A07_11715 [Roseateles sp. DAIF2]